MTRSLLLTILCALVPLAPVYAQDPGVSPQGPGWDVVDPTTPDGPELDAAVVETARVLLSGYHGLPDQADFEAAVPNAEAILWSLASSSSQFPLVRDRALAALGWYASPAWRDLLVQIHGDATAAEPTRHRALTLLVEPYPAAATTAAIVWSRDVDIQRRLSAVHALAAIVSDEAIAHLQAWQQTETDALVRDTIGAALRLR